MPNVPIAAVFADFQRPMDALRGIVSMLAHIENTGCDMPAADVTFFMARLHAIHDDLTSAVRDAGYELGESADMLRLFERS